MNCKEPLISVIMACYNEEINILKESVYSIIKQTYKNIEFVIVCDNPNNKDHIEFLKKISLEDKRIKVHINEMNRGLVFSLNKALNLSKGAFIARMDADDISVKTRLYDQLKYLKEKNLDIIGGDFLKISNDGKPVVEIHYPRNANDVRKYLKRGDCVGHPTWFAKRDVYIDLNGYDDIPLCEDYHFLLKARAANFQIGNMPKICLFYRLTPNSISRGNLAKQAVIAKMLSSNADLINSINRQDVLDYLSENETKKYIKTIDKYIISMNQIKQCGLFNCKREALHLIINSYFYEVVINKLKDILICPRV